MVSRILGDETELGLCFRKVRETGRKCLKLFYKNFFFSSQSKGPDCRRPTSEGVDGNTCMRQCTFLPMSPVLCGAVLGTERNGLTVGCNHLSSMCKESPT